ncbi:hypothetical protein GQ464_008845 [Rhodocaloribacter litoris]|uniref:hypothetical protein n=1 Tax=Rhodocaloribacter litoris TaxID=2558931 RepID=UPI00142175F9|nr:hypothetical protein [Rhodocaloribacter litoris]QXD17022.1 hypothetical protein GQ464_008845 [Rhodocaloribacter litoris]
MTLTQTLDEVQRRRLRMWRARSGAGDRLLVEPRREITPDLARALIRHRRLILDRLLLSEVLDTMRDAVPPGADPERWRACIEPLSYFDEAFGDLEEGYLCCWFWYSSILLPRAPFELPGWGAVGEPHEFYHSIAEVLRSADRGPSLSVAFDLVRELYRAFGRETMEALSRRYLLTDEGVPGP